MTSNSTTQSTGGIKRRGFGSMSTEERSRIASMGGKQAHRDGTAHQFTSDEAREAGRKGGLARSRQRLAVATMPE